MSPDAAPEQRWGTALSSGSFSPATELISFTGAKRALGSNTSSLPDSGLCIRKHLQVSSINKSLGSKGQPCPSFSKYHGWMTLPLYLSAWHLQDGMGWDGMGWDGMGQPGSS